MSTMHRLKMRIMPMCILHNFSSWEWWKKWSASRENVFSSQKEIHESDSKFISITFSISLKRRTLFFCIQLVWFDHFMTTSVSCTNDPRICLKFHWLLLSVNSSPSCGTPHSQKSCRLIDSSISTWNMCGESERWWILVSWKMLAWCYFWRWIFFLVSVARLGKTAWKAGLVILKRSPRRHGVPRSFTLVWQSGRESTVDVQAIVNFCRRARRQETRNLGGEIGGQSVPSRSTVAFPQVCCCPTPVSKPIGFIVKTTNRELASFLGGPKRATTKRGGHDPWIRKEALYFHCVEEPRELRVHETPAHFKVVTWRARQNKD